jgi:hypothetical protein
MNEFRSRPRLPLGILMIEARWAGYLPPSWGARNRMTDIKRGRRRVRRVQ